MALGENQQLLPRKCLKKHSGINKLNRGNCKAMLQLKHQRKYS